MELSPTQARLLWKSLLANASELATDVQVLLDFQRYARAQTLMIVAKEEIGKSVRLYKLFSHPWSSGDEVILEFAHPDDTYLNMSAYFDTAEDLGPFWGDFAQFDLGEASSPGERDSWRGFLDAANSPESIHRHLRVTQTTEGVVVNPSDVVVGDLPSELTRLAEVIEMCLIVDHTRMKHESVMPYDTTIDRQEEVLRLTHPELQRYMRLDEPE
ncbi:MAG: AbiV family abortive infection protein [Candidatus Nanopelagicales bacterium]